MRQVFLGVLICCAAVVASPASARELASKGDALRILIADNYKCQETIPITINTKSAVYYDQDAQIIQRLVVNTAGAILGFECAKVQKLDFFGYTGQTLVFRAKAQKAKKWDMESYPPPLETLALYFGLREPAFEHLGIISEEISRYASVAGIVETNQYQAFRKQASRLVSVVDGDTEKFIDYLENPGHEFKTFEAAKTHYGNILRTIEEFAPEQYAAYRNAYNDIEGSLKDAFWSARVTSIIEDNEIRAAIVAAAVKSVTESGSPDYRAYVDDRIAAWMEEDADLIAADVPSVPLYELGSVSEYLGNFPAPGDAKSLSKTKAVLEAVPGNLIPLALDRLAALETLAMETIRESGSSYVDVDAILEAGFAIAGEFEEAGYVEEGERLVAAAFAYVNEMLASDLDAYRAELRNMAFTAESVAALQEQALIFEELSADIPGFKVYKRAAVQTLEDNKTTICREITREAGIEAELFTKPIDAPEGAMPLIDLACRLFENQHRISALTPADGGTAYALEVTQENEEKHRFLLKAGGSASKSAYSAVKRLEPEESQMSRDSWHDYIANLLDPPPSGEPDAQGVRECDRLAADPHDSGSLAPGIDYESENAEIDPEKFDRALDACIAAVENAPDDARQHFQLGRLLWLAGDQEGATEFIDAAAEAEYAPALYYQAEILLGTSDDPDAFIDALHLYEEAGKAGYERGNAMVKELNPEGLDFFKEIPPPTPKEIISALKVSNVSQSMLGVRSSARVVDVKIKDCFQTSATDFSCEYRKILKCSMSGWGNDPVIRMMSWAIQKDCDTTMFTFDSFRNVGEGQWKELPSQY